MWQRTVALCFCLLAGVGAVVWAQDDWLELLKNGSPAEFQAAIAAGADVNDYDEHGYTPLIHAASSNPDPEVIRVLLEAGADVNQGNYDVRFKTFTSPLLVAVRESTPEVVRILIDAGADVNQRNHRLATALTAAVYRNDLAMVTLLLSAGAKVNVWDGYGNTVLRIAEREGSDPAIIQALQEATPHSATLRMTRDEFYEIVATGSAAEVAAASSEGADANTKDEDDYTVLMHALRSDQDLDVIQLLLEAGADVNSIMALNTGWQALVVAAASNTNPDVIKALVAAGARLDYKACGDQTPLLAAAQSNPNPEIIHTPIQAGVAVEDRDAENRSLLMLAVRFDANREVIRTLIELGLDVNDTDSAGRTPLMVAVQSKWNSAIGQLEILLEAGANPLLRDNDGKTAWDYLQDNSWLLSRLTEYPHILQALNP
jgi:ankyrin repeat protein